ncbi:MAG TPA: DUF1993 domain-containing protein [Caulobacteraceae bacterium]|nr:DUF1993 domain-containing protein [Caulobacteraceae bacterium]
MSFTIYDASAPVFVRAMTNISAWLDKALAEGKSEAELLDARLAPDMRPFTAQVQMSSDTAKNAIARLAGMQAPAMADTEASFAELKDRCRRTIDFVQSVDRSAIEAGAEREIVLSFPNGVGYRFEGGAFLTSFALPNFFFHVTTAYAVLRTKGVNVGKADFLQHLGPPVPMTAS